MTGRISRWAMLALFGLVASSCAFIDVHRLASDEMGGRQNGTAGSTLAQQYLIDALGPVAQPLPGEADFLHPISGGTNVIGHIPGTELADEYVVVGAHYDHVGSNCSSEDPTDTICNGATDNATGVGAMLDVARILAHSDVGPRRSVIFAAWDREEDGLLGSAAFMADPPVPADDIVAYVNFDIVGANLLPSLRPVTFAVGAETGGDALTGIVDDAIAGSPLDVKQLSSVLGQGRSDYQIFVNAGIPTVFFTDSTGPCYHTAQDEVGVVDFGKLFNQTQVAARTVRALADVDTPPTFVANRPLIEFGDAVALLDVVERAEADLDRFPPDLQEVLLGFRDDLQAIVSAGPDAFGDDDVTTVIRGALDAVFLLASGVCDGFLAGS